MQKKLIITIPAKDEQDTLPNVVHEIHGVIKDLPYDWEIMVVNDGSTDKTAEVCDQLGIFHIDHHFNLGLAETFRTEMEWCVSRDADIIIHIDADGQYDPKAIPLMLKMIEEGHDLVLASRFAGKIESMPLIKRLGNKAFSKVISTISKHKITDGQTGFRAFTKDVAKIKIKSDHTYTQEQILRAAKLKFHIIEIPTYFRKRDGESRLISNPFEYAYKAWINILRVYRDFEPLKFFGLAGLGVLALSVPLLVRAIYFVFKGIPISSHLFSMVMMIVLFSAGLQIILFGFLADMMKGGMDG